MTHEFAFEMAASSVRFGPGVTREVGMDLVDHGVRRALVVTDATVARLAPMHAVLERSEAQGIEAVVYDRVRVEPTDVSFREAIAFANGHEVDGFVAVGGGSMIDTAKAVNLYTTYPPARLPRLRERADRQGAARAGAAQAAHRDPHDGRHRQRDDRREHLRPHARCTPRPASRADA